MRKQKQWNGWQKNWKWLTTCYPLWKWWLQGMAWIARRQWMKCSWTVTTCNLRWIAELALFDAGYWCWGLVFSPLFFQPQHLTPAKINIQQHFNCSEFTFINRSFLFQWVEQSHMFLTQLLWKILDCSTCGVEQHSAHTKENWSITRLVAGISLYEPNFIACGFSSLGLPVSNGWVDVTHMSRVQTLMFFPRASERRVLPIVGVCTSFSHLHIFSSSHFLIFTSSNLHTFSSSHLLFFTSSHFTSSHLHIFSSSHLLIFTSSHLHIFSSSHLLIFTSSHLLIFISSHPHIFTSSHPHIFTSSHLHIFSSSHLHIFTSSHLHILTSSHLLLLPSCPLALLPSCPLTLLPFPSFLFLFWRRGGRGSANETARNATLSHETRFDRQKLK